MRKTKKSNKKNNLHKEIKSQRKKILSKLDKTRFKKKKIIEDIQKEVKKELGQEKLDFLKPSTSRQKKLHIKKGDKEFVRTGIAGFDALFEDGIPKKSTLIVAGGAGSGKTIFCLQTLYNHAMHGGKCFYMSFEESKEKLKQHMLDFGWDVRKLEKKGSLRIERYSPFDIARNVDALLMKAKGELLIDIDPVIMPKRFKPSIVILDSLTAVASAFTGKEDSYRIYIEQLFRFFEKMDTTVFLITETEQVPTIFSQTGVEEFLADGVIVLYSIKRGNMRENAIEVLKLRGAKHKKKIVAMDISDKGIEVYPEQEVFSEI